jgi:hypothetical protein
VQKIEQLARISRYSHDRFFGKQAGERAFNRCAIRLGAFESANSPQTERNQLFLYEKCFGITRFSRPYSPNR